MGVITWPEGQFSIVSKLSPGLALALAGSSKYGYSIQMSPQKSGDQSQLWTAVSHPQDTGTCIQNVWAEQFLTGVPADPSFVVIASFILGYPWQTWKIDDYPGGGWMRIWSPDQNWFLQFDSERNVPQPMLILAGFNNDWAVWKIVPDKQATGEKIT